MSPRISPNLPARKGWSLLYRYGGPAFSGRCLVKIRSGTCGQWTMAASRSASWTAASKAATPTFSSSSAPAAAIIHMWITPRSRRSFSGFAGPLTLEAALEAYDKHLGPLPGPNGDSAGSLALDP